MPVIINEKNVLFELRQSPVTEFAWHTTSKLAEMAGSKQLLFEIRSLDPGKYSYPYHFHRSAEEVFVIMSGRATLRTPSGFQEVQEGDTVFFETGPEGAHQLFNHTGEACRYLDIRTNLGIDICEYPDSGKINILPYEEVYLAQQADYYEGEDHVAEKWKRISSGQNNPDAEKPDPGQEAAADQAHLESYE